MLNWQENLQSTSTWRWNPKQEHSGGSPRPQSIGGKTILLLGRQGQPPRYSTCIQGLRGSPDKPSHLSCWHLHILPSSWDSIITRHPASTLAPTVLSSQLWRVPLKSQSQPHPSSVPHPAWLPFSFEESEVLGLFTRFTRPAWSDPSFPASSLSMSPTVTLFQPQRPPHCPPTSQAVPAVRSHADYSLRLEHSPRQPLGSVLLLFMSLLRCHPCNHVNLPTQDKVASSNQPLHS